jgi:16S rRNA processing protein RimM
VGCLLNVSLIGLDRSIRPKRTMPFQMMGLTVNLPDGTRLGEVVDMVLGSLQHCLIVENGDERYLVPNTPEVVVRIDHERGTIDIDPPEGLLDLRW